MSNFIALNLTTYLNLDNLVSVEIYENTPLDLESKVKYVAHFNLVAGNKIQYFKGFETFAEAKEFVEELLNAKNS